MSVMVVETAGGSVEVPFVPGKPLREILARASILVRWGCGGGACGLCRVRILAGERTEPTPVELRRLTPEQLAAGERLACQSVPRRDLTVAVPFAGLSLWQELDGSAAGKREGPGSAGEAAAGRSHGLGLAVDLGVTQVRLSLWDLQNGTRLAGAVGPNLQLLWGSEVATRLAAACDAPEVAREMGRLSRGAITAGLAEIATRTGCSPAAVSKVVIVGNSAMLTLLTGKNYQLLLKPGHWSVPIECDHRETDPWCREWGIAPGARIRIVPPLAGFVGSDLVAAAMATRLARGSDPALLIDFGASSEIALWDGTTLRVTSATGGPAFEGCGISCGMPAAPGAIYHAETGAAPGLFSCRVLGGGEARGICGTGLVDAIAELRQTRALRGSGAFSLEAAEEGRVVLDPKSGISINRRDIGAFQRAKAAIGAGTLALLGKAGLRPADLRRVLIGGALGRLLNLQTAQAIGLLPQLAAERFELCGDCALTGCEELLLAPEGSWLPVSHYTMAKLVHLPMDPDFEPLYLENLQLRPMAA